MEWFMCLDYFNDGSFQEISARLRSSRGAILALCPLAIERTTTTWRGRLLRLAISGNSGNPCKIRGIPTAPKKGGLDEQDRRLAPTHFPNRRIGMVSGVRRNPAWMKLKAVSELFGGLSRSRCSN